MSDKLRKLSYQTYLKVAYNIGKIPSNLKYKYELLKCKNVN